jgi:hypothetical protein
MSKLSHGVEVIRKAALIGPHRRVTILCERCAEHLRITGEGARMRKRGRDEASGAATVTMVTRA